jgi:hypothetical protein
VDLVDQADRLRLGGVEQPRGQHQLAGADRAEIIISSVPNALLKGITNVRLVQQVREINRTAKIIAPAETFADVPKLYAAGADFVSVPRMIEAKVLCNVIAAVRGSPTGLRTVMRAMRSPSCPRGATTSSAREARDLSFHGWRAVAARLVRLQAAAQG